MRHVLLLRSRLASDPNPRQASFLWSVSLAVAAALVAVAGSSPACTGRWTLGQNPSGLGAGGGNHATRPAGDPGPSFFAIYVSGLPPNVSAPLSFASWGPNGGWSVQGRAEDGFAVEGGLGNGNYTLSVLPAPGFIPVPSSATYFVTDNSSLNITVDFVRAPCYQTFTEVGLPFGSEWWVIDVFGLAFFSNGTTIDALGCPSSMADVSVGSATNYRLVAFPSSSTFYPGGASIPVAFGPPSVLPAFPATDDIFVGLLIGGLAAGTFALGERPRRPRKESTDGPRDHSG